MKLQKALRYSILVSLLLSGGIGLSLKQKFSVTPWATVVFLFLTCTLSIALGLRYFYSQDKTPTTLVDRIFGGLGGLVLCGPIWLEIIMKLDFPDIAWIFESNGMKVIFLLLAFSYGFACYSVGVASIKAKSESESRE